MNITRGLLRLWLVSSALWAISIGAVTWKELPVIPNPARYESVVEKARQVAEALNASQPKWQPPKDCVGEDCYEPYTDEDYDPTKDKHSYSYIPTEQDRQAAITSGLQWALIPPLLLFAIGGSLVWAARGFRR
jgi:hypothetical protein